jgi:hypothetical protein
MMPVPPKKYFHVHKKVSKDNKLVITQFSDPVLYMSSTAINYDWLIVIRHNLNVSHRRHV